MAGTMQPECMPSYSGESKGSAWEKVLFSEPGGTYGHADV